MGTICLGKPPHIEMGWLPLRVKKERGLGAKIRSSKNNRDAFFFFNQKMEQISPCTSYLKIQGRSQLYGLKKKKSLVLFWKQINTAA